MRERTHGTDCVTHTKNAQPRRLCRVAVKDCVKPHVKKLIGTIVLLIWLPIYALVAMGIGVHVLPHAAWFVTLLYYASAGTLWIIPVGLMLPWMNRDPGL